jgi:DNA-binding NarL/FixJ family response regulator
MHPTGKIRVLYIEDDERLHAIVPRVVEDRGLAWTCAASAAEGLALATELQPDLVLTDLGLPDLDGVDLIEQLVERLPGTPVVVLTVASSEARVVAALAAGACGYVLKEDLGKRLPSALVEVLEGGVPMSPAAARAVLAHVRCTAGGAVVRPPSPRAPGPPGAAVLSPRERDVVEQLGRGLTYEQVATVLGVSINTVRAHVRAVYEKLGATSKTEAVMLALRRGLVHPG